MISNTEIILRLLLAAFLGGLVGMEREAHNRPAGLRTHVLVTLGSALVMMISIDGFKAVTPGGYIGDPARLAAQVVTGIGFLGAGTILHTDSNVKGLTTAASLWVCGGIGLAIGGGYYLGGTVTVIIVLLTLTSLGFVEKGLLRHNYKVFIVNSIDRPGLIGELGTVFGKYNMDIKDMKITCKSEENDIEYIAIRFLVKTPSTFSHVSFLDKIYNVKGVEKAAWEKRELSE